MPSAHREVLCLEAPPLHGGVGPEDEQHPVPAGHHRVRHLGAAEPPERRVVRGVAVVQHHVVVGALLVGLHLELGEDQLDAVPGGGGEDPDAVLLGRVVVGKVRAAQLAGGVRHLVLAAALLAVVLVVVEDETCKQC